MIRCVWIAVWLLSFGLNAAALAAPAVERLKATVRFDLPRHQMRVQADLVLELGPIDRELWIALADHDRMRTEIETVKGDRRFSWVTREQPENRSRLVVVTLREQTGERLPLHLEYRVTAPESGSVDLNLQPDAIHASPASQWWPVAMTPESLEPAPLPPRRTELKLVVPKEFLVHGGGRIEADHEKGKVRHVQMRYQAPDRLEPYFLAAPYQRREFDHDNVHLVLLTLQQLPRVPGVLEEIDELISGVRGCQGQQTPPVLAIAETEVELGAQGGSVGFHSTALVGRAAFEIVAGRPHFKAAVLRALGCPSE